MSMFGANQARAVLFHGADQPLELIRAPIPPVAKGELLIEVECCNLCSSDLHTHSGRRIEPTPTVLGHEIVGRIMTFGEQATRTDLRGAALEIGDRVTWTIAASCGHCPNCRDGLEQKCAHLIKYGHEKVTRDMPFRGGLADVALLSPGTGLVKLPTDQPELSPEVMALANCSSATVVAALRAGFSRRNRPGSAVLVLGAGVLGLTACAMARQIHGAAIVIACDRHPSRAQRARQFGATHTCHDLSQLEQLTKDVTANLGVDVALELAGTIETTCLAIKAVRTGGTVILAGTTTPTEPLVIEPQAILRRMLRIEGVHNYRPGDLVTAVEFLTGEGRRFPMGSLVGTRYGLGVTEAAFGEGQRGLGMRIAVTPVLDRLWSTLGG